MAKSIRLTPDILEQVRKEFNETIEKAKLSDGKITFTKTLGIVQRKATVYFTEIAWLKMQSLIREFDKEIAWHGVAYRGDDPSKDEYTITDILVYPQEVTGSTVTTDQEKYQSWLYEHDDEVFSNIRMQGHSHVNFSTSPSGVDISLYERILEQLDDDMFYIFLIYNKKGEKTYMIYDMRKNVLFETADVTVKIIDDGSGITSFLEDAKKKVTTKTYTPPSSTGGTQYTGAYRGSWQGGGSSGQSSFGGNTKPSETKPAASGQSSIIPIKSAASDTPKKEDDGSKKKRSPIWEAWEKSWREAKGKTKR